MSIPTLPALLSALFLAGSTGAAVTAVSSDGPGKARSERAGKPEAKHAKALGLCAQIECTPEQKAEIAKLREEMKAERKEAHERVKAERAAERDALKKMRAEHRDRIHDVLDEEQRAALAERMEERRERAKKEARGEKGERTQKGARAEKGAKGKRAEKGQRAEKGARAEKERRAEKGQRGEKEKGKGAKRFAVTSLSTAG